MERLSSWLSSWGSSKTYSDRMSLPNTLCSDPRITTKPWTPVKLNKREETGILEERHEAPTHTFSELAMGSPALFTPTHTTLSQALTIPSSRHQTGAFTPTSAQNYPRVRVPSTASPAPQFNEHRKRLLLVEERLMIDEHTGKRARIFEVVDDNLSPDFILKRPRSTWEEEDVVPRKRVKRTHERSQERLEERARERHPPVTPPSQTRGRRRGTAPRANKFSPPKGATFGESSLSQVESPPIPMVEHAEVKEHVEPRQEEVVKQKPEEPKNAFFEGEVTPPRLNLSEGGKLWGSNKRSPLQRVRSSAEIIQEAQESIKQRPDILEKAQEERAKRILEEPTKVEPTPQPTLQPTGPEDVKSVQTPEASKLDGFVPSFLPATSATSETVSPTATTVTSPEPAVSATPIEPAALVAGELPSLVLPTEPTITETATQMPPSSLLKVDAKLSEPLEPSEPSEPKEAEKATGFTFTSTPLPSFPIASDKTKDEEEKKPEAEKTDISITKSAEPEKPTVAFSPTGGFTFPASVVAATTPSPTQPTPDVGSAFTFPTQPAAPAESSSTRSPFFDFPTSVEKKEEPKTDIVLTRTGTEIFPTTPPTGSSFQFPVTSSTNISQPTGTSSDTGFTFAPSSTSSTGTAISGGFSFTSSSSSSTPAPSTGGFSFTSSTPATFQISSSSSSTNPFPAVGGGASSLFPTFPASSASTTSSSQFSFQSSTQAPSSQASSPAFGDMFAFGSNSRSSQGPASTTASSGSTAFNFTANSGPSFSPGGFSTSGATGGFTFTSNTAPSNTSSPFPSFGDSNTSAFGGQGAGGFPFGSSSQQTGVSDSFNFGSSSGSSFNATSAFTSNSGSFQSTGFSTGLSFGANTSFSTPSFNSNTSLPNNFNFGTSGGGSSGFGSSSGSFGGGSSGGFGEPSSDFIQLTSQPQQTPGGRRQVKAVRKFKVTK